MVGGHFNHLIISPEQPDLGDGGKRVRLGKLNEETEKIGESAGKGDKTFEEGGDK